MTDPTPNPGSVAALTYGCLCPVLDNAHGEHPPFAPDDDGTEGWVVRVDCPVHGGEEAHG